MTISRERTATSLGTGTAYAQFGRRNGERDDRCPQIALGRVPGWPGEAQPDDYLYIICEPVEMTARAAPVGASIMAAIREAYAESERDDPVAAIAAAVSAANDALYAKNRAGAPGLRVFLGVTCLVIRDNDLIICQVPPTQAIVSQNGVPIALPALESWLDGYQPQGEGEPEALGMRAEIEPLLYRATLERDDLITLCSANLSAILAEEHLGPLVGDDPEAGRDFLADLAERRRLDPAYAVVLAPPLTELSSLPLGARAGDEDGALRRIGGPGIAGADEYDLIDYEDEPDEPASDEYPVGVAAASKSWLERSLREMRERSRVIPWPRRKAPHNARVIPLRQDIDLDAAHGHWSPDGGDAETGRADEAEHARQGPDTVAWRGWQGAPSAVAAYGAEPDELDGAGWSDRDEATADDEFATPAGRRSPRRAGLAETLGSIAALIVLVAGSAIERIAPAGRAARRTRDLEDRRGGAWPIGSLERWSGRGERRLPFGRWLPLVIVAAIVVAALTLVVSVRSQQARAAENRFATALAKIGAAREAAVNSPDRAGARAQILTLRPELDKIATGDQPDRAERVAAERAALAQALDRVEGIERLGPAQVQLLAATPAPAGAAASRPQIVLGDGQQFVLLNGVLYAVDGRAKTMTKILTKGDSVAGVSVGQLLGATWRIDSLLAFDESHGYLRDATGSWRALPLAATGRKVTAADTFDGNLYLLEAERGQIGKFPSGGYASVPQPWSSAKTNGELALALDMTIDKDIYVLLSDGRILDFYQGELKGTLAPATVPPLAGASAIHAAPDGKALYLVDPKEGRIVRVARDGNVTGAFKAAEGAHSFVGARELAVDEAAGIAYLLTDEGLLSVRLPAGKP